MIVCHIRTSNGARFSIHRNEEELRVELIDYYNECLAEGNFQLADDTDLEEAQDAIEEMEDVSWEEIHITAEMVSHLDTCAQHSGE